MSNENTERSDRAGWYEFIMPGGSTTHIAYAHENGTVYLPEGEDVVSVQDFHLASASDRFWRLVREPKQVTTVAELDALPQGTKLYSPSTRHSWALSDLSQHGGARVTGTGGGYTYLDDFIKSQAPLTVLHTPGPTR